MSRSGLGAKIVVGLESAFGGSSPTLNRPFEFNSESLQLSQQYLLSKQLRGGKLFPAAARRVATTRQGAGNIQGEVPNQGFGPFLTLGHGNAAAPVQQGVTTAYKQTHDIGLTDPFSKSLAIQVIRPTVANTDEVFTYVGCKMLSATFKCDVGGFLTFDYAFDIADELTADTTPASPAAATYTLPTGLRPFHFAEGSVTVDGSPAGNIKSVTVVITVPQDTDRFFFGGAGVKASPIVNDQVSVQMMCTVEWASRALYAKYRSGALAAVVCDFTGPTIASTYKEQLTFTAPSCGVDGATPNADGPGILTQDVPFTPMDPEDGNAPLKIEYVSKDTAI